MATHRPLLDSYKAQVDVLERKATKTAVAHDTLQHDLEQARKGLNALESQRAQERRVVETLEERVRELESQGDRGPGDESTLGGGALQDALAGTTTRDLKLQVLKLERQLASAADGRVADSQRLMTESLLEDALRIKARYEGDYLAEHRRALVFERQMEDVMSRNGPGDGCVLPLWTLLTVLSAQALAAARIRLVEATEQLATLRQTHAALELSARTTSDELALARSDRERTRCVSSGALTAV